MEQINKEQLINITLISTSLSFSEIQSACSELNVQIESPLSKSTQRDGSMLSEPLTIALITGAATIISTIAGQVIQVLIEKFKLSKKTGFITVKTKDTEIQLSSNSSQNDINKTIEIVKKLKEIDQIFVTSPKEEK